MVGRVVLIYPQHYPVPNTVRQHGLLHVFERTRGMTGVLPPVLNIHLIMVGSLPEPNVCLTSYLDALMMPVGPPLTRRKVGIPTVTISPTVITTPLLSPFKFLRPSRFATRRVALTTSSSTVPMPAATSFEASEKSRVGGEISARHKAGTHLEDAPASTPRLSSPVASS